MSELNKKMNELSLLNNEYKNQITNELQLAMHSTEVITEIEKSEFSLEESKKELSIQFQLEMKPVIEELDINPKGVYLRLLAEKEFNPQISKSELTLMAYDLIIQNTKSKILKKIAQQLKKEEKKIK